MQNACVEWLEPFRNRLDYRNSTVVTAYSHGRHGPGHGVPTVQVFMDNLKLHAFS